MITKAGVPSDTIAVELATYAHSPDDQSCTVPDTASLVRSQERFQTHALKQVEIFNGGKEG